MVRILKGGFAGFKKARRVREDRAPAPMTITFGFDKAVTNGTAHNEISEAKTNTSNLGSASASSKEEPVGMVSAVDEARRVLELRVNAPLP